ncbi:cold shock domain-containing protein, partial [Paenibacillus lactis]|uniref:cold shock domain-containing protein n=1 Tax=Paenibacillus lactis TaxID=228574 RepID=UPI0020409D1F
MFIEGRVFSGLNEEEMAEVHSLIGPSLGKSPVAPPKPNRKMGKAIGKAVENGMHAANKRLTGTVILYRDQRGFGFIKPEKGKGQDVFFHIKDAADPGLTSLKPGERVSYELVEKDGRP